jgi:hypothetical protein
MGDPWANNSATINPYWYDRGPKIETCELTCQTCSYQGRLKLSHATPNTEVVAAFRKVGWKVRDDGFGAQCPEHVANFT